MQPESRVPTVKVDSSKQTIGRHQTYPLATGDVVAALEPKLIADLHVVIHFSSQQAYWKEEPDAVGERGLYRVASLWYRPVRPVSFTEVNKPWAEEESPQIVDVDVYASPRSVLPAGTGLRRPAATLLALAVASVAPDGIPPRDRHPSRAWIVDIEYDARSRALRALLKRWNGGEYAVSRQLESIVGPR